MNQQIIDYLQTNKDNYTKESLITQLQNAGYNNAEITEAVNSVYGDEEVSIKISSNEGDQNEVKYAGFMIRFSALVIDDIIILFPALFFSMIVLFFAPETFARILIFFVTNDLAYNIIIPIFFSVIHVLYSVFMINKYQATFGKKAVRIKVCDADTLGKASLRNIFIREIIRQLLFVISPSYFILFYIVIIFTKRKQGLYDMVAKTVVVYKN